MGGDKANVLRKLSESGPTNKEDETVSDETETSSLSTDIRTSSSIDKRDTVLMECIPNKERKLKEELGDESSPSYKNIGAGVSSEVSRL